MKPLHFPLNVVLEMTVQLNLTGGAQIKRQPLANRNSVANYLWARLSELLS